MRKYENKNNYCNKKGYKRYKDKEKFNSKLSKTKEEINKE
jgi:hypothetical protein